MASKLSEETPKLYHLSNEEMANLSLCFRKIQQTNIFPEHVGKKIIVERSPFHHRERLPAAPAKPLSKCILGSDAND